MRFHELRRHILRFFFVGIFYLYFSASWSLLILWINSSISISPAALRSSCAREKNIRGHLEKAFHLRMIDFLYFTFWFIYVSVFLFHFHEMKTLIFNWKQSSFSSKKGYGGREERELDQWAKARTTTHGHEEMRGKEASTMEEEAKKRRAEIARFDSGFSYVIHGFLLRKMNFLSIFFFPLCYDLIGFKNCTLSRVTLNHWWRPKASISIRCIITIQFEISGVSSSFESIYSSFDNVDDPSFIGLNYKSRASKVFENVNYGIYFNCVCLAFQFVFKIYFNSLLLREYYIYLYSGRSILLLAIWSYSILIHVTIWSYSIF